METQVRLLFHVRTQRSEVQWSTLDSHLHVTTSLENEAFPRGRMTPGFCEMMWSYFKSILSYQLFDNIK